MPSGPEALAVLKAHPLSQWLQDATQDNDLPAFKRVAELRLQAFDFCKRHRCAAPQPRSAHASRAAWVHFWQVHRAALLRGAGSAHHASPAAVAACCRSLLVDPAAALPSCMSLPSVSLSLPLDVAEASSSLISMGCNRPSDSDEDALADLSGCLRFVVRPWLRPRCAITCYQVDVMRQS